MTSPFRRLSREVLVEHQWHRYCRDRFTQTDDSEGVYHYIDIPGSCGIIPLFGDGSTVLVHGHRYLLDCQLWEFPIGGIHAGETPLEVARRELREETGMLAEDWQALGAFAPYKGASNERCHFFVARDLSFGEQALEPCESMTVHRMPFEEARRRILEQPLPDGQSMAGLMLFDQWRARQ